MFQHEISNRIPRVNVLVQYPGTLVAQKGAVAPLFLKWNVMSVNNDTQIIFNAEDFMNLIQIML